MKGSYNLRYTSSIPTYFNEGSYFWPKNKILGQLYIVVVELEFQLMLQLFYRYPSSIPTLIILTY